MSLSTDEIEQIEKSESALLQRLYHEYKIFSDSPLESSYLAVQNIMQKWNQQIADADIDITNEENKQKFEMVHKYIIEMDGYVVTLEKLRQRMSPKALAEVDAIVKKKKRELMAI